MADQTRKVYSFKSVGSTLEQRREREVGRSATAPIGFITPLSLSTSHAELFEMHTDLKKQIRDNFRNMLTTNHGDRLMLHDFGANLLPLATELGSEEIDSEALNRIAATTEKYMPFISLETFETTNRASDDGSLANVVVSVTYSIPGINVSNQRVEAIIFAAG